MIKYFKSSIVATFIAFTATSPSLGDVKIGFLGGFTGPVESIVPPIFATANLAIQNVNEQGGILNGQKLIMIQADTTCADATAAANAADKLVNIDKVAALVGPLCSGATISAANNAAIPAGIPIITPASTSPVITSMKDNDLLFRVVPSDAYQGAMLAKLLMAKNIGDIAITYVNNDYGKALADTLARAYKKAGGGVLAKEAHEDNKADYRAELGSLASSGTTTLVILAYANSSGQTIIRQAIETGDFEKLAGAGGLISNELASTVGYNIDGFVATKPSAPDGPGKDAFNKLMAKAGQDTQGIFIPQAYDAAFILALAIEQAGTKNHATIAKSIRKVATAPGEIILPGEWKKAVALIKAGKDINYEGAGGSQEFDKNGDVPGSIMEMTIKNGKFVELGIIQ